MSDVISPRKGKVIVPFLIGRAVRRFDSGSIPGHYCATTHVWVVDGPNGPEPLVRSREELLELVTKTKVEREQDDQRESTLSAAITKTAVQSEGDDEQVRISRSAPIFELATKTEAQRERDD